MSGSVCLPGVPRGDVRRPRGTLASLCSSRHSVCTGVPRSRRIYAASYKIRPHRRERPPLIGGRSKFPGVDARGVRCGASSPARRAAGASAPDSLRCRPLAGRTMLMSPQASTGGDYFLFVEKPGHKQAGLFACLRHALPPYASLRLPNVSEH